MKRFDINDILISDIKQKVKIADKQVKYTSLYDTLPIKKQKKLKIVRFDKPIEEMPSLPVRTADNQPQAVYQPLVNLNDSLYKNLTLPEIERVL